MRAYQQVVSNKGSAGVDGMPVKELYAHLYSSRTLLESDIRSGGVPAPTHSWCRDPQEQRQDATFRRPHRNRQNAPAGCRAGYRHQVRAGVRGCQLRLPPQPQRPAGGAQGAGVHQRSVQPHRGYRPSNLLRRGRPLPAPAEAVPQGNVPAYATPNPQVATSAHANQWEAGQTAEGRTSG